MTKLLLRIVFCAASFSINAQHVDTLKKQNNQSIIDSINAAKWNENTVTIEDASKLDLVNIPKVKIDTLVLDIKSITATPSEPVPVTPYSIMNSPSERTWYFFGQNDLLFNQASFSNWNAGGTNNIGFNAKVNYSLIYKSGRHFVDNNVQLRYGLLSSKEQSSRKTDDYIQLFSNYGYDLRNNFYLSAGFQLVTQFSPGFNYGQTPNPVYEDRISSFMAPGYLDVGLGLSYNPKENLQVILRPATGRFTFVLDPQLQKAGTYGLEEDGQSIRTEIGALLNVIYKLKIIEGLTFTNQLNMFSSYTAHPERVDISYSGVLDIRFSKHITTVVSLDLLYDHDQIQKLQIKQTLGVGFAYSFGTKNDKKPDKKIIKPFAKGLGG